LTILIIRKPIHLYKKQYDIWRGVYVILVMCSFIPNLAGNGYEYFHAFFMDEYWLTNCTGNTHCDIGFDDYMKLKRFNLIIFLIFQR